jgi:hypothetical protein
LANFKQPRYLAAIAQSDGFYFFQQNGWNIAGLNHAQIIDPLPDHTAYWL